MSANTGVSMVHKRASVCLFIFVLSFLAEPSMSWSSFLKCLRDGRLVATQLLSCKVLLSGASLYFFHLVFYSMHFIRVQVVQLYSSTETVTVWKNYFFISPERSEFHKIMLLLIRVLTSLSVDEILLLRYPNRSTNFRGLHLTRGWNHFD